MQHNDGRTRQGCIPVSRFTFPFIVVSGNPKLYEVHIASGTESIVDSIGFRRITTHGTEILLNGKPLFLRGIAIHEEAPVRGGRAVSTEDARILLGWAKELGCNYIRLAHYPHNVHMIREAEKMGILIWAEIPVYWTILWNNPETYSLAEQQLEELITRIKIALLLLYGLLPTKLRVRRNGLPFLKSLSQRHGHSILRVLSARQRN